MAMGMQGTPKQLAMRKRKHCRHIPNQLLVLVKFLLGVRGGGVLGAKSRTDVLADS